MTFSEYNINSIAALQTPKSFVFTNKLIQEKCNSTSTDREVSILWKKCDTLVLRVKVVCVWYHIQQYFSSIMVVSFNGENPCSQRKPLTSFINRGVTIQNFFHDTYCDILDKWRYVSRYVLWHFVYLCVRRHFLFLRICHICPWKLKLIFEKKHTIFM